MKTFAKLFNHPLAGQVLFTREYDSDKDEENIVVRISDFMGCEIKTKIGYGTNTALADEQFELTDESRVEVVIKPMLSVLEKMK